MKKYNIAVVGATGMVGRKMLEVLEERAVPINNFYAFASAKSAGSQIEFGGKSYTVIELNEENIAKYDIDFAISAASGGISKIYAPIFAKKGTVVVDNSSQWRMDPSVPLVVPEVNAHDLSWHKNIIANPNCTTIQAVVALNPLHKKFKLKRVVYSTYQAVSGAGVAGYDDLKNGVMGKAPEKFARPIFGNVIPQIDVFMDNGYTKEEEKMINETRKILGDDSIRITATNVRVPVFHGHSESINAEFVNTVTLEEAKTALKNAAGVKFIESAEAYPTPLEAENHDEVYVGRLRIDKSVENGIDMWVVADNIRKGAATNAVQIVETLISLDNKN